MKRSHVALDYHKTRPTLYYFCAGATSSTSSGCRGVSLTLNKTEGYERTVYETAALNANRLLKQRLPYRSVNIAFSSCQVYKEKPQTIKQNKSYDASEVAWEAAQEVAPAATCRITNKTMSRHLARNVMSISLAVGGWDSRRDLEKRGSFKREHGLTGLIEQRQWMICDEAPRWPVIRICLGLT